MLQQQASELRKLSLGNQANWSSMGDFTKNNKTSDHVLDSLKNLFEFNTHEAVDCTHRFCCVFKDYATNKNCKEIVVRYKTFKHMSMLYRARSKLKEVKVRSYVT